MVTGIQSVLLFGVISSACEGKRINNTQVVKALLANSGKEVEPWDPLEAKFSDDTHIYPSPLGTAPGGGSSTNEPFKKTVRKSTSEPHVSMYATKHPWCPGCVNADLCARRFLFVVSTGRSGSTTTMNMLNGIPGLKVYGENDHLVKQVREFLSDPNSHALNLNLTHWNTSCATFDAREVGQRAMKSWNGPRCSPNRIERLEQKLRIAKDFVGSNLWRAARREVQSAIWEWFNDASFSRDHMVLGFKEIRWELSDIDFLEQVAPCSRYIFNFRERPTTARFNATTILSPAQMQQKTDRQRDAIKRLDPTRLFQLPLPVTGFNLSQWNALAQWLGRDCKFRGITHSNHGDLWDEGQQQFCNE